MAARLSPGPCRLKRKVKKAPKPSTSIPRAIDSTKALLRSFQSGRLAQLTIRDALRHGLLATEVLIWVCIGEIIGKGGLTGYNV